ncbi:MAG: metal-dependent hydrolase [Verrucomicrobia bacterium]|nr:metal-dependent hydrolase [Verrucomicrobiota bacterium]
MSPITHLLASWLIAAKTTDNPRDCRLVTLAGLAPDLDGAGMLVDVIRAFSGSDDGFIFYQRYHHWVGHGLPAALVITALFACFAKNRARVAVLTFAVFHLHLLFDLVGSRGPSPADLWPIYYLGPLSRSGMWLWAGQWPLDAWPNRVFSVVLFFGALALAARLGHSVVGVFNHRADVVFIGVLRGWCDRIFRRGRAG